MDKQFDVISGGRMTPNAPQTSPDDVAVGIESIRRARTSGARYERFKLMATGGTALVRRPSMLTLTAGGRRVPESVRGLINSAMRFQALRAVGGESAGGDIEQAIAKQVRENENILNELIDTTVMIGFVNPRVVPIDHIKPVNGGTAQPWPGVDEFYRLEGDPKNPAWVRCDASGGLYPDTVVYLDEIEPEDRAAYFEWCQRAPVTEAAAVAEFPEVEAEPLPTGLRSEAL